MNKSELVELIATKANLHLSKSEEIVDLFFNTISQTLAEGNRVEIRGFGAFSVKDYEGYQGRNPKTGDKIYVEPKRLPVWRTGTELKRRVDK